MASRTHGLRAIALATLVAVAGISAQVAPVAATDPAPSESPAPTESPAPSAADLPTESPAPSAADLPSESPAPTDPAPTESPAPSAADTPLVVAPDAPVAQVEPTATSDLAGALAVTSVTPPLAPRRNYAARIVRIALAQRGDRYVRGATGPNAFDCSGLVRYSYRKAGVSRKLGGGNSARGMLHWARIHGLTGKRNPHVGDVVIYGNGSHAAIYIGRGRVVHALNRRLGIRVTGLHAMRTPFTTFIHMDRRLGG